MRRIAESIRASFYGLLGDDQHADTAVDVEDRVDRIKLTMLDSLGDQGKAEFAMLFHKLKWADNLELLWYSRSELMASLGALYGESRARNDLQLITSMFKGSKIGSIKTRALPPSKRRPSSGT